MESAANGWQLIWNISVGSGLEVRFLLFPWLRALICKAYILKVTRWL
jgi:hypothetical protein